MRILLALRVLVSFAISAGALCSLPAAADDVYARLKKSLVFITAEGVDRESGQQVSTEANGFITSLNGTLLTNYHIIRKLGKNVSDVSFKVSVGSKNAQKRGAQLVSSNPINDLIRLRLDDTSDLSGQIAPVTFMAPSALEELNTNGQLFSTKILTMSFMKNVGDFLRDDGKIHSTFGPSGYLWVSNLKFAEGQSGSPIFLEDGRVIGVVKGDQETVSYFIPNTFAQGIETAIGDAEIKAQLDKVMKSGASQEIKALIIAVAELQKQPKLDQEYRRLERENFSEGKFGLTRQGLAQATCVALAPRAVNASVVFAIGRRCTVSETETCAVLCPKILKGSVDAEGEKEKDLRCVDSLFIPGGKPAEDNGQLGLKTTRYGRCNVNACGPNFCCCAILKGGSASEPAVATKAKGG